METEAEKSTGQTHMPLQHRSLQESQRGIHTTNRLSGFLTQLLPTRPSLGNGNDLNNKNVETIPKASTLFYTPVYSIRRLLGNFLMPLSACFCLTSNCSEREQIGTLIPAANRRAISKHGVRLAPRSLPRRGSSCSAPSQWKTEIMSPATGKFVCTYRICRWSASVEDDSLRSGWLFLKEESANAQPARLMLHQFPFARPKFFLSSSFNQTNMEQWIRTWKVFIINRKKLSIPLSRSLEQEVVCPTSGPYPQTPHLHLYQME